MRTWTLSTPRSSSFSTRHCVAGRSPLAAGSCLPLRTKPRPSGCAAGCRDGGRASSARNSRLSVAISRTTNGWATPRSGCWVISRRSSIGFPSTKLLPTSRAPSICLARRPKLRKRFDGACGRSWVSRSRSEWRTKHLAKIASQVAKPDGLVVVDPETELDFLHDLPVELMWGVGPVTKARLAETGVLTIGQLARLPRGSLEPLLGDALGQKLGALAWNRDLREIKTHRRARSAGAQSALGKKPAAASVFRPTLRHLADRVGSRLRAKSRLGRTVSVRVRFADLRSVTRSVTLPAPISATATLAEIAEELVRRVLADHPDEQTISLLAISVSNLEDHSAVQLEFPLGLADEGRRPGAKKVLRVGWSIALSTGSATASDGRRSATRRLHWELSARFPTRSASSPKRIYDRRRERRASWQQCEPFSWHRPMGLERRPVRARASRDHAHDRRAPEDRALSAPTRRRGLRPDDGQRCALSRRADERQLISIRPIAL